MVLTTGQITVIDLNDAVTLQGYLNGSHANGQSVDYEGVVFTPSWGIDHLVITATLSKMGDGSNIIDFPEVGPLSWSYILGNGAESAISSLGYAVVSGTNNQILTINANRMTLLKPSIKFIATFIYTHPTLGALTYKMDMSYMLQQQGESGGDAYTVILGNENQSFGASETGNIATAQETVSMVSVYKGSTAMPATIGTIVNPTGMTFSISNNGSTYPSLTITALTGTTLAPSGTVVIPITVDGKLFNKVFSYTKVNGGAGATTYSVNPSVDVLVKDKMGIFIPTTLVITLFSKFATDALNNPYFGRLVISESANADGSSMTVKYSGVADLDVYTYTPTSTAKMVKIQMYKSGGITTLLDQQTVPVVTDGVDTILSFGSTPLGNVFYNSLGKNPFLNAKFELYRGNLLIIPASFLWFYQDPLVTTTGSTGYNAKGGLGWHLISNVASVYGGATTNTLSIYANAVGGYEVFKCVATHNSIDYTQHYSIVDQTDPYQLVIESTGGDKFKNAIGNSILTAKVLQAGLPLDVFGAGLFSYTWTRYDKDSAFEAFTPTPATMGYTIAGSTALVIGCDAATIAAFDIGSIIIVGTETARLVTAKTSTTLTVGTALSTIPSAGKTVKDGSLKRIYIDDTHVTVKTTFYCDIN